VTLWLLALIANVLLSLLLAELFAWFPWLARKVLCAAVRWLPAETRERYRGEWLAEVVEIPGAGLSKLLFALRVLLRAAATRAALAPDSTRLRVLARRRVVDLSLSVLSMVTIAPAFAALAVAVRLWGGPGPVLVRERRCGRAGQPVELVRFRTHVWAAESRYVPGATLPYADWYAALTPAGRFLTRSSLDYLPQYLNVVAGDLSLIGPPACHGDPKTCSACGECPWVVAPDVKPGIAPSWRSVMKALPVIGRFIR
jgi:lipopolysaccharide/colanic/teichoic acid biosynthesis glycosyltransferase